MIGREQPLVSILMGAYHIGGLHQFPVMMEGLLHQTHENIEIIICNDGSLDDTAKLLTDWSRRDLRVRILTHEKNQGLAASINDCMRAAKGTFLARQDADDISHPTRLAEQVAFLQSHPGIDFVGTNVNLYGHGGVWGQRHLPEFPQKKDFLFCSPFVHGTVMYRAMALNRMEGYRVDRRTYRTEDYALFMRMYALGMKGANLQQGFYDYWEDEENMAKRKYRYRVDEAMVRYDGFRRLGLLPKGIPYILKPLLVGLLPPRLLFWLKCRLHIFRKTDGEPRGEGGAEIWKKRPFYLPNLSKNLFYCRLCREKLAFLMGTWALKWSQLGSTNQNSRRDLFVDYTHGALVYQADTLLKVLADFDVVSFDLFDTIFIRKVKHPTDVFRLMQERLKLSDFALQRQQAERVSRQAKHDRTGSWEVTFEEIYDAMPQFNEDQKRELQQVELMIEAEQLMINPVMRQVVAGLQERGQRIIVLSDMYLDASTLRSFLRGCDFSLTEEIYVSSAFGVSKSDGRLFETVCGLESLRHQKIVHIGDNFHSDVYMGKNKVEKCLHYIREGANKKTRMAQQEKGQ